MSLILRVAVATPVRRSFDYLWEQTSATAPLPGCRVRVPFGRGSRLGVVLEQRRSTPVPAERLKPVEAVVDESPLLCEAQLALLLWAAEYYLHPVGEVVVNTLPGLLRKGRPATLGAVRKWHLSDSGRQVDCAALAPRAARQAALIARLQAASRPLGRDELASVSTGWSAVLSTLIEKGWVVEQRTSVQPLEPVVSEKPPGLSESQQQAVETVEACTGYGVFVLDGVTGSGKTEVYLKLIERVLARGGQTMVLVPEIGLTPQTVARFEQRFRMHLSVLHSGLSEQERLRAWLMARAGLSSVIIGTRSAVFAPLSKPGLFIVDEEHDASYKQQEGFRYSARDLVVKRASEQNVPVVLGSATPSLESLNNIALGRYTRLELPERAGGARHPDVTVVDVRGKPFASGLSTSVIEALEANLERGEQSLLFLNRRGFAPALLCHACGWAADCHRCDVHMVYHQEPDRVRCHHCGIDRPKPTECPECGSQKLSVAGVGTERVTAALKARFPDARVARLDRDTTQRKGAFESILDAVKARRIDILVGTQMLAKGHDFPNITLAVVLDADGGLFGADFRASERMAQLLVQVAGRAGRGQDPGRVLIQTHHPDHPLLSALLHGGYGRFAEIALEERRTALLPPCSSLALLRTEAPSRELGFEFLAAARDAAPPLDAPGAMLLGPVPAPMERRAGRYRAHLLVQGSERRWLHRFLASWVSAVENMKQARRVRWSLDVDPQDMI